MTFWRGVAAVGKGLIWSGMLILAFVAYQLWGTGLAEARNQTSLRKDFAHELQAARSAIGPKTPPPSVAPPSGAVAIIKMPKIGVDKTVVEGVGVGDLKKGPGHYPETPMPGQSGNAAIAGHRTTYGAPFYRLDEMAEGDPIIVSTREGEYRYVVSQKRIVGPDDSSVLDASKDNLLTITTCHPRFTASQRLVLIAKLEGKASATAPTPPPLTPESALHKPSLSGDRAPRQPAVGWGTAAAFAWLGTWALSRMWRKWPGYLVGAPAVIVLLFLFFENFSRLLPANI